MSLLLFIFFLTLLLNFSSFCSFNIVESQQYSKTNQETNVTQDIMNLLSNLVDSPTTMEEIISKNTSIINHQTFDNQILDGNRADYKPLQIPNYDSDIKNDNDLMRLYEKVDQSIVHISSNSRSYNQSLLGSGFVYDKEGHIITTYHVLGEGSIGEEYNVFFINGMTFKAKLLGIDPFTQIAVLQINSQDDGPIPDKLDRNFVPLPIGNFSQVHVGDRIAAFGNPSGQSAFLTEGIVSGLGRLHPFFITHTSSNDHDWDRFNTIITQNESILPIPNTIQTDAVINPANLGGPLLNMNGEVIGINTLVNPDSRLYSDTGFAIPSYFIQQAFPSLVSTGKYIHPYLGLSGVDLNSDIKKILNLSNSTGFLVTDVNSNSSAERAGVEGGSILSYINGKLIKIGGDIIVGVDDNKIRNSEDLFSYLEMEKKVGDNISLSILRGGHNEQIKLILGPRPNYLGPDSGFMPFLSKLNTTSSEPLLGITGISVNHEINKELNIYPIGSVSEDSSGFLVVDVIRNSSADVAGLRGGYIPFTIDHGKHIRLGGDIIISVDGFPVHSSQEIDLLLSQKDVGDTVYLDVLRDNITLKIPLTLKQSPANKEGINSDRSISSSFSDNQNSSESTRSSVLYGYLSDQIFDKCTQSLNKDVCHFIWKLYNMK